MAFNQAYKAYQKTSISTASQAELVVLLYEGAIKRLASASAKFGSDGKVAANKIEEFSADILRAEEIITELQVALDMERGGEIAGNLMSLYVFFNEQLRAANIEKDKSKIDSVLKMMSDLAKTWRQAAASTANAPSNGQPSLNIQG